MKSVVIPQMYQYTMSAVSQGKYPRAKGEMLHGFTNIVYDRTTNPKNVPLPPGGLSRYCRWAARGQLQKVRSS